MRITFRIWVAGVLITTETHDSDETGFDLGQLRERHERVVEQSAKPWMIEIEVGEGPPEERFLRFGTDPALMRDPVPHTPGSHHHPWSR